VTVKTTGLGDNLYVAQYDLSGDTGAIERVGGGPSVAELTGIDKYAIERGALDIDGGIDWKSWFNSVTDQEHTALSGMLTTDRIVTYCRGTAIGSPAASCLIKQLEYSGTRETGGGLSLSIKTLSNNDVVNWGTLLTAGKRTDTSATNGSGVDYGSATNFGVEAYLHVFSFTGTSVDIALEDSADDASYSAVTGGAFATVSAVGQEKIQTANDLTVARYLRVVTSGTFSEVIFAVNVVRAITARVT
jgi:hypothetical protein